MSYKYIEQKAGLFTESGQVMYVAIRDNVTRLLAAAGAVRMDRAMSGVSGDSWMMLACLDRMVELGELRELTGPDVAGQDRVFVR